MQTRHAHHPRTTAPLAAAHRLTPGRRRAAGATIAALAAVGLGACGDQGAQPGAQPSAPGSEQSSAGSQLGSANLTSPEGDPLGEVTFTEVENGTQVELNAESMEPGFYGFHVHQVGECEPDSANPSDPAETGDFLSAGSHIPGSEDAQHPDHAGDLPVMLVNEDGTATMSVVTDRLDASTLMDEDGSSVIIHSEPDNYANIPERYAPEADEDSTSTGDAGDRLACGAVEG